MPTKKQDDDLIDRSEVSVCSPDMSYQPLNRQIVVGAQAVDGDGEYLATESDSLYSVITSFISNDADSLESLKALEDCALFALTEIAKRRAELLIK